MKEGLNVDNIGVFNVGTLASICAKQDAIMAMLSHLLATQTSAPAQEIYAEYQKNAANDTQELLAKFNSMG